MWVSSISCLKSSLTRYIIFANFHLVCNPGSLPPQPYLYSFSFISNSRQFPHIYRDTSASFHFFELQVFSRLFLLYISSFFYPSIFRLSSILCLSSSFHPPFILLPFSFQISFLQFLYSVSPSLLLNLYSVT